MTQPRVPSSHRPGLSRATHRAAGQGLPSRHPIGAAASLLSGLLCTLAASPALAAGPAITVRGDTTVQLQTDKVQWRVDGPFAQRDMWLRLRNPGTRPVEATLVLPLGDGEQLQGFALDIDGELRDAVPVERVKAKAAFEAVVRAGVDPALVEKDEGAQYRVRVFPIPAQGVRLVRVTIASLGQRATCGWRHSLATPWSGTVPAVWRSPQRPVSGLTGWQAVSGPEGHGASTQLAPQDRPMDVCLPAPAGALHMRQSLANGQALDFVDVPAPVDTLAARPVRHIELAWDNSLNPGQDRARELAFLEAYLNERLRAGSLTVQLSVIGLGVDRERLTLRDARDVQALLERLAKRPADGASGLASWSPASGVDEVLLFSPLKETWPVEAASNQATAQERSVPVHVASSLVIDPAKAMRWQRTGGVTLPLAGMDNRAALAQLDKRPATWLRLGPATQGWKAEQLGVAQGRLRACHIGGAGTIPRELPIWRQDRPGSLALPDATASSQLAFWCGTWAMMDAQARGDTGEMRQLGQQFGVTGPETSLLVLERPEDYVRQGVDPGPGAPASLRDAVQAQQVRDAQAKGERQARHLRELVSQWQARARWWQTDFPKDTPKITPPPEVMPALVGAARSPLASPPPPAPVGSAEPRLERVEITAQARRRAEVSSAPPLPSPAAPGSTMAMMPPPVAAAMPGSNPAGRPAQADAQAISGILQAVRMDEPYTAELLATRDPEGVYQRYLSLRGSYAQSPAFYFDAAERLEAVGDRARALTVLSNMVQLMPSEPDALRVVAYRLQQAGQDAMAIPLLKKVAQLAPHEPQSLRDLGLAQGKVGACQLAGEQLAHTVDTPWDGRFAEIGLIALAELNALSQRCPGAWPDSLPQSLKRDLPVGLRAVLRWNLNDTDIDLHVTDPLGEEVYYANRLSRQGGAMSRDFTAGYGPEEFVLKQPKPGRYRVAVNYFGSRKATLVRGAIVQVDLQSGFGTPQMRQQTLTLRLLEHSGQVAVGEFEVDAQGRIRPVAPGR